MHKMKIKKRNVIVFGFALFAMFFGAGNVIFPPFLGMQSSPEWGMATLGYLLTDVIIATFSIMVMAKNDDGISCVTGRLGKIPSVATNRCPALSDIISRTIPIGCWLVGVIGSITLKSCNDDGQ